MVRDSSPCYPGEAPCSCIPRSPNRSNPASHEASRRPADDRRQVLRAGRPVRDEPAELRGSLLVLRGRDADPERLRHRRRLVRRAGRLVHDRVHDRLARSWAGWAIAINRQVLLAGGVALWSLATVGTAFSADFWHMFFWRALLGIGEASYGVDRAGPDRGPVPGQGARPGDGRVLPGAAAGHGAGLHARLARSPTPGLAGGLLRRRPARAAGRASAGLVISDPGRGASEERGHRRQGRPARPERLPRPVPDPDLPVQHGRHGRRHLRHGRLRRPGARRSISASTACRRPRPASGSACSLVGAGLLGHRPGHRSWPTCSAKLTRRAYLLLAAVAVLAAIAAGLLRHPRSRVPVVAGPPVRRVGPALDGARAVQHGDGQRRAGQPTGHRLRHVHLPDPPLRRYQLAGCPGLDLQAISASRAWPPRRSAGSSPRSAPSPVRRTRPI